jgi:hypothetical protein
VGSETPRGFNHGPAMGPGVSTTNNFAFISACDKHTAAYSCLCRIQPLRAYVPGRRKMLEICRGRVNWAPDRHLRWATAHMGFKSFLFI